MSAVVVATAVAWVGCNQWQGVELTESNLVSPNGAITQGADELRTNWYPDQPGLDVATVSGPNFKQLFKTPLLGTTEKVLAQPLVVNGKVLIASEDNNLYLLDAVTGAITTSRQLGAGFDASGALGCGDIGPRVGITGTPVIDTSSNTAYFFSKSSAGAYALHAVDAGTLAEKGGFPVTISGTAQNDATKSFNSTDAHQRPGLLLMGGVVYGAFASHCDHTPYVGWIIGVTTGGVIKARFATSVGTGSGDGIWMSGSGLSSDGAGNILFATGNPQGASPAFPASIASNAPPANLDESAVRAVVQADGSLKATDFFAPFNAQSMGDDDLAGGGIISLPSQFGTASVPHTAVIVGKAGLFYVLNRDQLGGFKKGGGNGNAVLTELNLNGGTWGHPAVWPGDGGYVAVTTNGGANAQTGYRLQLLKYAVNGGNPSFSVVGYGTSPSGVVNQAGGPPIDNFGSYAGSPTVTSNGTNAGSAVVWAVGGGNLRAYKIENNMLVSILSKSIGASAKFQTVGIGSGRVYVGTADGNVFGFGAGSAAITGGTVAFGNVTVGQQKVLTATITASQNLTIPAGGLTVSPNTFTLGATTPALPATLTSGQSLTVPVTFKPTVAGAVSGSINVTINGGGGGSITLNGTGQVNAAQLNVTPATVAFGGITTGTTKQIPILIQNTGNQTLTFGNTTAPAAPFSVTGLPASGATLAAGANITATVTFAPTTANTFSSNIIFNSDGGNLTVPLTGAAGTPPHMVITPLSIDYGTTSSGVSVTKSFTVSNTGGTDLQINLSKAPALGQFVATTALAEGSALPAGQTVTETVKFTSTTGGTFTDSWKITGSDSPTAQFVNFTGTVSAPLSRTGWVATASNVSGDVPANMLDGALGTRFSTGAAMAAGMWIQMDMGAANTISQVVMDSNGSADYARAFTVYVSNTNYAGGATTGLGAAVANGTATASPASASFTAKSGRYIVVVMGTVPAGVTSWWSIHEFNAYGTSGGGGGGGSGGGGSGGGGSGGAGSGGAGSGGSGALPRAGWVATASNTSGDVVANMLDDSLATRWSSGAAMAAGMWVQIDLGAANSVGQIVMDSNGSGDYARAFDVYVSNTAYTGGATTGLGAAVANGTATASPASASFTAKSGRYIVVVMGTVPAGVTSWWSIHEFNAYGTSGGGGGGGSGGGGSGGAGSGGGGSGGAGSGGAGGSGGSVGTVLINAGGPAASPYVADVSFTGGTTINHANTIDVSGVTNPAPAAVYQTGRTGTFSYTLGGFTAGSSHTVRLHMCETYFDTTGARTFNVSLNGTQVLTAFDIRATAGAKNKAVVQQFTSNANASGQYVMQFTTVVNNALVSGIEIN